MGAIAALALAPLALTGCTGASSSAAPGPTSMASTATASVSPGPTPYVELTPPPLPQAAYSGDESGAKAFAKYFFEVVNYVTATEDSSPLKAISDSKCSTCAKTISSAEKARTAKEKVQGAVFFTKGAEVLPESRPPAYAIQVALSRSAGRTLNAEGSPVASTTPVPDVVFSVHLSWRGDKWLVTEVSNS